MSNQPFPLASDFEEAEPISFNLQQQPGETPGNYGMPLTMPQRLFAMERRQAEQGKELKSINTKVDQILKTLSWRAKVGTTVKATAPLVLAAAAAQFPQAKGLLKALLDIASSWQ